MQLLLKRGDSGVKTQSWVLYKAEAQRWLGEIGLLYTSIQSSLKSDNNDIQYSCKVASASVASGEAQNLLPDIVEYHFLGYIVSLQISQ